MLNRRIQDTLCVHQLRHICVETKRNASSLNNVVHDLCLTVWLCPPLTNVFPCSSQNDGDDLWSRLVWASNDVCDAFWFGDGDESGQQASLNYCWRLMKTGESNYFVRCKVRCAFGRMEHILCPPPQCHLVDYNRPFVSHVTVRAASLLHHRGNNMGK